MEFRLHYDNHQEHNIKIQFTWLYGLIRIRPSSSNVSTRHTQPEHAQQHTSKITKKSMQTRASSHNLRAFIAILQSPGFKARIWKLLKDCLHIFNFHSSQINLRFGFNDPADTGQALAVLAPPFIWTQQLVRNCTLTPDFEQEIFHLRLSTSVSSSPLRAVRPFLLFIISPATLRALRTAYRTRRTV